MEKVRYEVSMIVGWDIDCLLEGEIVRVMVEIVVENISDGIIVLFFYVFIGGGVLVFFYWVINICDLMVGYKNDCYFLFGYFSVKIDDVLNYILSWLIVVVMMVVNVVKS